MTRIAVVCARQGSKGLPGKNVRLLAGRPLIAHAIEQAKAAGVFATVAVTSDSRAILEIAGRAGADALIERPPELATDAAAKIPAIRHCVETVEARTGSAFAVIADLAVTSPLRSPEDIRGAVALLEASGAANVLSARAARNSPYFNIVELDRRGRVRLAKAPDRPIARRQDAPPCFDLNGAIYVWTRSALFAAQDAVIGEDTRLFVMPEERAIDIDSEADFLLVELIMNRGRQARGVGSGAVDATG